MKKTNLLLTVFAILFTCLLNSSSAQYTQYNFGIEGGVGSTALVGSNLIDLDTKPKFGFITGLFGQYNFSQNYALKLSVNYQLKGADAYIEQPTTLGNTVSLNGDIKLDYVTIPLLFRARYGSTVKFFVNAGPYLGILLTNTETIYANSTYNIPGTSKDNTDSTKSTDFGITAGLGLTIPISSSNLVTLEFRDDVGLTNISDYASNTSRSTKNNSFNILVGLSFGTGKKYTMRK